MRISDWSSDVCSSDLEDRDALLREEAEHAAEEEALRSRRTEADEHADDEAQVDDDGDDADDHPDDEEQNEDRPRRRARSEEHTSELQSLMRNSYAGFCWKQKTQLQQQRRKPTERN